MQRHIKAAYPARVNEIARLMQKQGLTIEQLAVKSITSQRAIERLLGGGRSRIKTFTKLARALGVGPHTLIGDYTAGHTIIDEPVKRAYDQQRSAAADHLQALDALDNKAALYAAWDAIEAVKLICEVVLRIVETPNRDAKDVVSTLFESIEQQLGEDAQILKKKIKKGSILVTAGTNTYTAEGLLYLFCIGVLHDEGVQHMQIRGHFDYEHPILLAREVVRGGVHDRYNYPYIPSSNPILEGREVGTRAQIRLSPKLVARVHVLEPDVIDCTYAIKRRSPSPKTPTP